MIKNSNIGLYSKLFEDDEVYFLKDKIQLKDLCIVLDEALNQKNELFLNKILTAIGKSLAASSIVSLDSVTDVSSLSSKSIIIFGQENNNLYTLESVNDKKVLYADSLSLLSNDKDLKTKLWTALQQMFLSN